MERGLLGALEILVGIGAIPAGLTLVMDPTGTTIGLSPDALEGGPFASYFVPGLVLLLVNGVASTVAGLATLLRWRLAGLVGIGLGAFLVAWIVIQVAIVGAQSFLQPVFLLVGLVECGLAVALSRRRAG